MKDQAASLRELVQGKIEYGMPQAAPRVAPAPPPTPSVVVVPPQGGVQTVVPAYKRVFRPTIRTSARVIAITSGKGGVGKTNLTVNLAIAMGKIGRRVMVIDADLGMANVDVVLGTVSKHHLMQLLKPEVTLEDVLIHGPYGVKYISGGSAIERAVDFTPQERQRLMDKLTACESMADIVLVDTGAGIGRNVLDFVLAADEVILVTSGAISVGTAKMGLSERPKELRMKQAAAAIGQCSMMHIYDKLFSEYNRSIAQILLTGDDVEEEDRAMHLKNTFSALLEMGVIPVVNENDSVSSAEIETGHNKVLGDNDTLSAIVASLCRAELLILLSDIDGLFDADPRVSPDARLIPEVRVLTPEIRELAGGSGTWRGTGGMATKLNAAAIAMEGGVDMVITNGKRMEDIYGIVEGAPIGTRFLAGGEEKA